MELQENIYKQVKSTYNMFAGLAGRHVVGFRDLSIDDFLEVQNNRDSEILYLIGDIAYGLNLWYTILTFKDMCRKPISWQPGLGNNLHVKLLSEPEICLSSGLSFDPNRLLREKTASVAG